MTVSKAYIGYIFAVLSFITTGIYAAFNKLDRVKNSYINPLIFNLYFIIGCVIFCSTTAILLSLFGTHPLHFTPYGLLSGISLGFASWFMFISLSYLGITQASTFTAGIATTVSFIGGIFLSKYPDRLWLSILSIILIIIGIIGVGCNELIVNKILKLCNSNSTIEVKNLTSPTNIDELFRLPKTSISDERSMDKDSSIDIHDEYNDSDDELVSLIKTSEPVTTKSVNNNMINRLKGILFCVLSGVLYGFLALPEKWSSYATKKLYFLPSFGIGLIIMIMLQLIMIILILPTNESWNLKKCFIPGILSGITWNLGFLSVLYAQLYISFDAAQPCRSAGFVLAVLIGIFMFNEVTDKRAIITTIFFAIIVLIGCCCVVLGIDF